MNVHHAHDVLAEAIGIAAEELDGLIARHFAAERTIRIDQSQGGWYCATIDGRLAFPPCPNLDTVIRFVHAFAAKEGVRVDEDSVDFYRDGHSVRVADSNVVPFPVRAEGAPA